MRPGLSWPAILFLTMLAVPRVVAHDLSLVGPLLNSVLVFVPPIVWIGVVYMKHIHNPFWTLTVVGVCYAVALATIHQILWSQVYGTDTPELGGNLAGLSPVVEQAIIRVFAVGSGLVTGTLVGALTGAVAWLLMGVTGRMPVRSRRS